MKDQSSFLICMSKNATKWTPYSLKLPVRVEISILASKFLDHNSQSSINALSVVLWNIQNPNKHVACKSLKYTMRRSMILSPSCASVLDHDRRKEFLFQHCDDLTTFAKFHQIYSGIKFWRTFLIQSWMRAKSTLHAHWLSKKDLVKKVNG